MRAIILAIVVAAPLAAADFTVHEWGTFTSVVGSDGRMLSGLEVEEERVPSFVLSHAGPAPGMKGIGRPVRGVTVKMETPVLYFYSPQPLTARIEVGFRGGSISQWYPDRVGGELLASQRMDQQGGLPPIDFAAGYNGAAVWQVDVLGPESDVAFTARREDETPQWPRARVALANRVRGPKGEVEGFIFYRGLANFSLPLQVTAEGTVLTLRNTGAATVPFAVIYDRRSPGAQGVVLWKGALEVGEARTVDAPVREFTFGPPVELLIVRDLPHELRQAGLNDDEARAMLGTWHESYFRRPGLRVLWIVPRDFTDAVLPIAITPQPKQLERVLIGRTEVLTPAFEAELVRDFAHDGGKRWANDRYFLAYRERVRQLGGVVDVAPAGEAL